MMVRRLGPADAVATNTSVPDPSALAGTINESDSSSNRRPVTLWTCSSACRIPSPISATGKSAVDAERPVATKRYRPSTTSNSEARVFTLPTSTASKVSASTIVLIQPPSQPAQHVHYDLGQELDPFGQDDHRRRHRPSVHDSECERNEEPARAGDDPHEPGPACFTAGGTRGGEAKVHQSRQRPGQED